MAGLDSYANGTKETWRGWQWNRIVEKLPGWRPNMGPAFYRNLCADKTVLYLCGPDDFDRQCALKKGFRNENLIACDLNEENCKRVRAAGGIAINENLIDALFFWKQSSPLDVVIADFCGGMNNTAMDFSEALLSTSGLSPRCVVSTNLLRGRDSQSSLFRSQVERILVATGRDADSCKHRGQLWFIDLFLSLANLLREFTGTTLDADFYNVTKPVFYTYKSGVQLFDSVVASWFGFMVDDTSKKVSESWKTLREQRHENKRRVRIDRKRIAAHMASVTQRRKKLAQGI